MSYQELVNSITPKEDKWKNAMLAFVSGGVIGAISEIIASVCSMEVMSITWIISASILTGMGVFDSLVDKFKMGMIIPTTGFAHSVTAASLEYKSEGLVTGIGSNYLKLAGSVILYGIISATVFALIKDITCLL